MKWMELAYLWEEEGRGALIEVPAMPGDEEPYYEILDRKIGMTLLIEDDEVYLGAMRELLRRGARIYTRDELDEANEES